MNECPLKDGKYKKKFKKLEVIGRGSYGTVYKVEHKSNKSIHAIKKIAFSSEYALNYHYFYYYTPL